jgi:hypothetical protein
MATRSARGDHTGVSLIQGRGSKPRRLDGRGRRPRIGCSSPPSPDSRRRRGAAGVRVTEGRSPRDGAGDVGLRTTRLHALGDARTILGTARGLFKNPRRGRRGSPPSRPGRSPVGGDSGPPCGVRAHRRLHARLDRGRSHPRVPPGATSGVRGPSPAPDAPARRRQLEDGGTEEESARYSRTSSRQERGRPRSRLPPFTSLRTVGRRSGAGHRPWRRTSTRPLAAHTARSRAYSRGSAYAIRSSAAGPAPALPRTDADAAAKVAAAARRESCRSSVPGDRGPADGRATLEVLDRRVA